MTLHTTSILNKQKTPNTVGEHIMNAKCYEEQNYVLQVNEYNLMKWVI